MTYIAVMEADLNDRLMRIISERNRRENEEAFQRFCEELLALPADLKLIPKENFKTDIELQPLRWMSLGIDLLRSRKVTGHVQLADGVQGPAISSYLPYPVFQMAAEIFLKGMWLCQFPECRQLGHSSFVDAPARNRYQQCLRDLTHDLLRIIETCEESPEYQSSVLALRFLTLLARIIRAFYFPPYDADKRSRWADSRYPKRVYDDEAQCACAEGFQTFPRAEWVEKLFCEMETEADRIWKIRDNLTEVARASHT
jgi:hypothetical protein